MALHYYLIADIKDIPERRGRKFIVAGKEIALFKYRDKIYALNNRCPHQRADLADGYKKDGKIYCPMHGWGFDLESGAYIGNEIMNLPTYPIKLNNSKISVGISKK